MPFDDYQIPARAMTPDDVVAITVDCAVKPADVRIGATRNFREFRRVVAGDRVALAGLAMSTRSLV